MKHKLYLIIKHYGEYSDHVEVPRWAFRDKDIAENLVNALTRMVKIKDDNEKLIKYKTLLGPLYEEVDSDVASVDNDVEAEDWSLEEIYLIEEGASK